MILVHTDSQLAPSRLHGPCTTSSLNCRILYVKTAEVSAGVWHGEPHEEETRAVRAARVSQRVPTRSLCARNTLRVCAATAPHAVGREGSPSGRAPLENAARWQGAVSVRLRAHVHSKNGQVLQARGGERLVLQGNFSQNFALRDHLSSYQSIGRRPYLPASSLPRTCLPRSGAMQGYLG